MKTFYECYWIKRQKFQLQIKLVYKTKLYTVVHTIKRFTSLTNEVNVHKIKRFTSLTNEVNVHTIKRFTSLTNEVNVHKIKRFTSLTNEVNVHTIKRFTSLTNEVNKNEEYKILLETYYQHDYIFPYQKKDINSIIKFTDTIFRGQVFFELIMFKAFGSMSTDFLCLLWFLR